MTEITMRERKKEATKEKILAYAIDLFNEQGFADTTMQLIAKRADVALRTLYNYFPSKESIVANYIREAVRQEVSAGWDELLSYDSTYERLLFMSTKSAEWMTANPILIEVYAADPRNYYYGPAIDEIPRSGYDEVVAEVMKMGQEIGDVSLDFTADVLARQYMGFYYFSVLTWLGNRDSNLFEIFSEGLKLLYLGIKPKTPDSGEILWGMFA